MAPPDIIDYLHTHTRSCGLHVLGNYSSYLHMKALSVCVSVLSHKLACLRLTALGVQLSASIYRSSTIS